MTEMVETTINGQWTLSLPEHRAARPHWSTAEGWERARWDSIHENVRPGDTVVDVGTEEGDLSALLATWVGPDGKVALIEPNPRVWPNIRAIFDANHLVDRVAAAWPGFAGPVTTPEPRPGARDVTASRDGRWPDCAYGPIIGDHGFCVLPERPDLPAITLDDLCERHGLAPTLITMDVEGAELEVLRGADRVLAVQRPLVYVSVHHEFMRDTFGYESGRLWQHMADRGYGFTRLAVDHEDHVVWHHPDGYPFAPPRRVREEWTRWQDEAATETSAAAAVWSEPDWEQGQAECLAQIIIGIDPALGGGTVLDLGCGVGRLINPLARLTDVPESWVGVDISARMLDLARRDAPPNVTFRLGDGRSLPLDEPLDAAYCVLMFQHIPTDAAASYVRQVARLLRPGGRFTFQFVDGPVSGGDGYSWAIHDQDAVAWCEGAGLVVERIAYGAVRHPWTWITAKRP